MILGHDPHFPPKQLPPETASFYAQKIVNTFANNYVSCMLALLCIFVLCILTTPQQNLQCLPSDQSSDVRSIFFLSELQLLTQ